MATHMTLDQAADSPSPEGGQGTKSRLRRRLSRMTGSISMYPSLEIGVGVLSVIAAVLGYLSLTDQLDTGELGPVGRTALLVAILLPFMGLIIVMARRIAVVWLDRRRGLAGARLHVRLLGLFAVLAAGPTILTVVFASLLFQTGTAFWFSDNAQTVLTNAESVAQAYVEENRQRIVGDIFSMGGDLHSYALDLGTDSELFDEGVEWQLAARNLTEAIIFTPVPGGAYQVIASAETNGALGEDIVLAERLSTEAVSRAAIGETAVLTGSEDRVEAIVRLDPTSPFFLYASRTVDPKAVQAAEQAADARSEYADLLDQSRDLQWRFNAMLGGLAIMVLTVAILSALWLANRLTAPIARMASAAERVGEGDLSARVEIRYTPDELGVLARSFNRMAAQLETQTGDLVAANARAETRRRFIEAVLEGVSAGVLAIGRGGTIELASTNATDLLSAPAGRAVGQPVAAFAPEFSDLIAKARSSGFARGEVDIHRDTEVRTLLVRVDSVPGADQLVITFDDVTQQLADQRRAAWADVARRIAHEIKNPLTPIQLSAERLQRRFGRAMEAGRDADIFGELTGTIVRQVADLRRMVDEFSSFARMPKPVFRPENLQEIARQTLFLQEVGHPGIRYRLVAADDLPALICDRRQISQALTNLLKNAAEAIQGNGERPPEDAEIALFLRGDSGHVLAEICDNGPGMPVDMRERVTEPYVTTREGGTGLGLAIVKKIVEEHHGELSFRDRQGGGTCAVMSFATDVLRSRLQSDESETEETSEKV